MMGTDGINGPTSINLSGYNRIIPGAMINIEHTGHDSLGHISPAENLSSFIEDIDYIAVDNTPLGSFRWMNPDWFIMIFIRTDNLNGGNLVEPVNIIQLSMDSPSGMIRYYQ